MKEISNFYWMVPAHAVIRGIFLLVIVRAERLFFLFIVVIFGKIFIDEVGRFFERSCSR